MNQDVPHSDESGLAESPCIGVCELDRQGVCQGCFRTSGDIGSWLYATNAEKAAINACAEKRKQIVQK